MAYKVLARKWRPQQFDEVVGQEHITRTLCNAIETGRIAHAYMFVGPRGTGKTTTARLLAKALNCEDGPSVKPDNDSEICRAIMDGNHLDVLEIDAASNTQVDKIRELTGNVRYTPAQGRYKVYIIDEVHMLSQGSFNALLKTLEEPPEHVVFILATTEPQKVPATVISRCQRFDFRRISIKDLVGRLSEISAAEEISINDDALLAIARGADGGLRDAESALDQLISFRGKNITEADVLSVFGLVARETLDRLTGSILDGDVPSMINIVAELDQHGKDFHRLIIELLEHFRNVLLYLHVGDAILDMDITGGQIDSLKEQASKTDSERVLQIAELLTGAENRIRFAVSRRTLLETTLIRCVRVMQTVTIDEILKNINALKSGTTDGEVSSGTPAKETKDHRPGLKKNEISRKPPPPEPVANEVVVDEIQVLTEQWHDMVDRVGRTAPLARNYLLDAKPIRIENDTIIMGFDPEFADNREKINFPRNRQAVDRTVSEILNRKVKVQFCVMDAKSTLPGDHKIRNPSSAEDIQKETQTPQGRAKLKTKQEWMRNPVVQKALEVFNGDIVDIRE